MALPESYRDILLANETAMSIQASFRLQPGFRPTIRNATENNMTMSQWGSGLNHGSTEVAHTYVKACVNVAKRKSNMLLLLRIDVKTAFAPVLREFTLPIPSTLSN